MSTIFDTCLNDFCRRYLVTGVHLPEQEKLLFPFRYRELSASIFEQFLLFDKISFKVYGENIPLAILINMLGLKNFEALIDSDAVEFVLWTPQVMHIVNEIEGVNPLVSGNLTSPAHSDPEASIELGLKFLTNSPLKKYQKHSMIKKLRDLYKLPDDKLSLQAANLVQQAYCSNKLREIGMPFNEELTKLKLDDRKKLCGYSESILETTFLADYNYSSFNSYHYALFKSSCDSIMSAFKMRENFHKIIVIENMPDVKEIFLDLNLNLDDLIKIRNKKVSKKFRNWLNAASKNADSQDITLEYLNAISSTKGFLDTRKGKFIKSVMIFSIGCAIEHFTNGITGSILGTSLALGKPADFALDMLDTYILDGLLKGRSPRLFIDEFRTHIRG